MFFEPLANQVQVTSFDTDGLVRVVREDFFLHLRVELRAARSGQPERIARNKRFAKYDQARFPRGRFVDRLEDFPNSLFAGQPSGSQLRNCDSEHDVRTFVRESIVETGKLPRGHG